MTLAGDRNTYSVRTIPVPCKHGKGVLGCLPLRLHLWRIGCCSLCHLQCTFTLCMTGSKRQGKQQLILYQIEEIRQSLTDHDAIETFRQRGNLTLIPDHRQLHFTVEHNLHRPEASLALQRELCSNAAHHGAMSFLVDTEIQLHCSRPATIQQLSGYPWELIERNRTANVGTSSSQLAKVRVTRYSGYRHGRAMIGTVQTTVKK